jgi:hypothetical protein
VKFITMLHADLAALTPEHKEQLAQKAHAAMFRPLRDTFIAAQARGEIRPVHPDLLVGSFLWLMDGLNYGEMRAGAPPRQVMAEEWMGCCRVRQKRLCKQPQRGRDEVDEFFFLDLWQ